MAREKSEDRMHLFSGSTFRIVCIAVLGVAAVVTLIWLYKEETSLRNYGDVRSAASRRDLQVADSVTPQTIVVKPQIVIPSDFLKNVTFPELQEKRVIQLVKNESKEEESWEYNWDRKQSAPQGQAVRTLVLIRHGQYNLQDGLLTDKGRMQANYTGARLRDMGMPFRSITHSTLVRAQETAQIISTYFPGVPLYEDSAIQEGGPIPPKPTITYWGLPERDYYVDGPRMESAFRKYFYRASPEQEAQTFEMLVGHGNIFRFFMLRALQFPREAWMRIFIAHASITVVHIDPDGTINMNRMGDSGHMPTDYVTW